MKTILTAVLMICALSALARLGETNVDISKRYGPVTKREQKCTNEWSGFYQFNGYNIMVTFSNNISVLEAVSPILKRTMPADEIERLKKLIGGEEGWRDGVNRANDCIAQTATLNGMHIVRVGRKSYIEAAEKSARDSNQAKRKRELDRKLDGF